MRRATDDRNQIRPRGRNIWADVKNEIPRIAAELYAGYPLLISYKILGQAGYIYIYNATCDNSGSHHFPAPIFLPSLYPFLFSPF